MSKPYYDEEGHVAVKNEIKKEKKQIFLIGDSTRLISLKKSPKEFATAVKWILSPSLIIKLPL